MGSDALTYPPAAEMANTLRRNNASVIEAVEPPSYLGQALPGDLSQFGIGERQASPVKFFPKGELK